MPHLKQKEGELKGNKGGFSAGVYEAEDQLPQVAVHNTGFMKPLRKLHGSVEQVGRTFLSSKSKSLACPLQHTTAVSVCVSSVTVLTAKSAPRTQFYLRLLH